MKGVLWKWTNYWNGWQPRWFILEDGVLSYYSSEEEVSQGCKGSVCVAACNINVHQTDCLRLDIVIPGEQHIYVRAAAPTERQQWLKALGSAKAQGLISRTRKTSDSSYPSGSAAAGNQLAKTKKSELRLYSDLLMQQVHSIKEAVKCEGGPDVQKLDESTNLLTATCDTFIKTLDECLILADANPSFPVIANPSPNISIPNGNSSSLKNQVQITQNKVKSIVHSNSS